MSTVTVPSYGAVAARSACTTAATASGSASAASPTCRTPAAEPRAVTVDAVLAGQPVAGGQHRPDTGQGRGHLQAGAVGLERQPAEAVGQGVVVAGARPEQVEHRAGAVDHAGRDALDEHGDQDPAVAALVELDGRGHDLGAQHRQRGPAGRRLRRGS